MFKVGKVGWCGGRERNIIQHAQDIVQQGHKTLAPLFVTTLHPHKPAVHFPLSLGCLNLSITVYIQHLTAASSLGLITVTSVLNLRSLCNRKVQDHDWQISAPARHYCKSLLFKFISMELLSQWTPFCSHTPYHLAFNPNVEIPHQIVYNTSN